MSTIRVIETLYEDQARIGDLVERFGQDARIQGEYLEVSYERPETPTERARRERRAEASRKANAAKRLKAEERERAEYERLRAKFDGGAA